MSDTHRSRRRFITGAAGAAAAAGLQLLNPAVAAPPTKPTKNAKVGFSHLGICVSDLDRSVRFYTQALGAAELGLYALDAVMPPSYRQWLEIPADVSGNSKFIALDGLLIELLYYTRGGRSRAYIGPTERRPMNQVGFTHLSLRIADVVEFNAMLARVREFGGHIVPNGHIIAEQFEDEPIECVFVTDPDGTRFELMRMPASYPIGGPLDSPLQFTHA